MHRDLDETEAALIRWADSILNSHEGLVDGYPEKASGGFIASWIKDADEQADAADAQEIGKIEASIASLSQPHQRIIHKRHKVGYMVWSFADEDALYHEAKDAFRLKHFCK